MAKTILIRMDRIGDLILTLPMDQYFQPGDTTWVISKGLEFVPENAAPGRKFLAFEKAFCWKQFFSFLSFLKNEKPELSISFHCPWWINFALFLAHVPIRVGVLSQWHSYMFLNRGVRQKRSLAQKHEAHYNLDLVSAAKNQDFKFSEFQPLILKSPLAESILQKWNLRPQQYIVIHPGMGGSALNWPMENYAGLAQKLAENKTVVITGTKIDADYVEPLKEKLSRIKNILFLDQKLSIQEMLLVLNHASVVLAPSTGVAHLAASLGTPTLGLYSPILVERALRWGPLGKRVHTLTPKIKDGKTKEDYIQANVMSELSVQQVFDELQKISK